MRRGLITALVPILLLVGTSASAQQVIYSNAPSVLAPNYTSLGYEATSTFEWGDRIQFAPATSRTLASARVVMSNWARRSEYTGTAFDVPNGFTVPITFTIYNVGDGTNPGSVISTRTVNQLIQWRPEPSASCEGTAYMASDRGCYNGLAQNIMFNFSGVVVPDQVIFGVAFNTQSYGYSPVGAPGPYNSLNVGAMTNVTTGVRMTPDDTYWANTYPVSSNNGTFRRDAGGWATDAPMVEFLAQSTVPEPSTYALLITGLAALGLVARRRRTNA
jgi:hypothetical protein